MGAPNPDVSALVAELALQYWTVANTPDLTAVVAAVTSQLSRLGGEINSAVTAFAQTQVTAVFTAEEALEEAHGGPASAPVGPALTYVAASYVRTVPIAVANLTSVVFDFNTQEIDTDAAVTTGAAWHFTCPVGAAGLYQIDAAVKINTTGALVQYVLQVRKNGATTFGEGQWNSTAATVVGADTTIPVGVAVRLVPGDTIDALLFMSATGTITGTGRISIFRVPGST
jgi:hypothetical protein